jgi:hypothetical protein
MARQSSSVSLIFPQLESQSLGACAPILHQDACPQRKLWVQWDTQGEARSVRTARNSFTRYARFTDTRLHTFLHGTHIGREDRHCDNQDGDATCCDCADRTLP